MKKIIAVFIILLIMNEGYSQKFHNPDGLEIDAVAIKK
jgi:hypothetical protein